MELLPFAMAIALIAAALARWTHWHPVAIAATVALVPTLLAGVAMAGFFADGTAILLMGVTAYIVTVGFAGFGAFMGWLRRTHVERIG